MFNKKGVSAVVANVLIILLVVVGVALIWSAVAPSIQKGSSGVQADCFTLNLEPISCVYTLGNNFPNSIGTVAATAPGAHLNITVKRNPGEGDLEALNFLIDGSIVDLSSSTSVSSLTITPDQSFIFRKQVTGFEELSTQTFTITSSEITSQTGENYLHFYPAEIANIAVVAGSEENICYVVTNPIECVCLGNQCP